VSKNSVGYITIVVLSVMIVFLIWFRPRYEKPILQPQIGEWVKYPVPHWRCPPSYTFIEEEKQDVILQNCEEQDPRMKNIMKYDLVKQELATWKETHTIPASGDLRVTYREGFAREPACGWLDSNGSYALVTVSEETSKGVTIHGKPGEKLIAKCNGVVNR
jgi:hypothetical protein